MTNIARHWPACHGIDMTGPAEIERMAHTIAAQPNRTAREPLVAACRANHSEHVLRLVRQRAQQIIHERR